MNARPFVVPVFIPHAGCPHRCVFCNQSAITGRRDNPVLSDSWRSQVHEFLRFRNSRRGRSQIAFYGGNFLGLPESRIRSMLAAAAEWVASGEIDGIRFSTRPDTVDPYTLAILAPFPVQTVELGAQSMDEEVLRQCRRGHSAGDTADAVGRLKRHGYEVGLQIMVGLPGEREAGLMETGRRICEMAPDFVRIYPTLVLTGSVLQAWYRSGSYRPLSLDAAVALTAKLYRLFRSRGIPVIRMGLQPTADLSAGETVEAGPFHPAFGHLVQAACFLDAIRCALLCRPVAAGVLGLQVHPKSISRMRGPGNANCGKLKEEFGFSEVAVRPDPGLAEDEITLPQGAVVSAYRQPVDLLTNPS